MFFRGISKKPGIYIDEVIFLKFIQTEKQKLHSPQSTTLETLREINIRGGLEYHKQYKDRLYRLEKGHEGEERLVNYLKKYGAPHWIAIRNMWLEHYGEFECDLLLLTRLGPLAFEIKNYSGKLELRNNQCFLNEKVIGHNPFSQAQKVMTNLSEILQMSTLQGVLTFVGEHNPIQMYDPISGIDVRMLNELKHYIWQISQQERQLRNRPSFTTETILQRLAPYEIGKPSKEKDFPGEIKTGVRGGIHCCNCNHFNLETNKSYMICSCGMHEPREEAIVRTICEYGVIYPERELTTQALIDFFDGELSKSTVFRYLTKHFKQIGVYRSARFINPKRVFEQNKHKFIGLVQPKYMRID